MGNLETVMPVMVMMLICLPCVVSLLMAVIRYDKPRAVMTYFFGAVIALLAILTAVLWFKNGKVMMINLPGTEFINHFMLVGDAVLMFIVIWLSVKWKKTIISVLSIIQTCIVMWVELYGNKVHQESYIMLDWFSIIMILIIGIVGVAIGVYAVGYMRGYHEHHTEVKARRYFFFAIIFLFYGAMFGLVCSRSLIWLYFFWEITSVCSFLLIGYTGTKEAIDNSFKALWMNLLGGLGIACAIWYAIQVDGTADIYKIIDNGQAGSLVPIALLAFAALTKSAQFPFSGWLLGAMVAPTPSSALLHSATMVKAGVYLLVRISLAMHGNYVGQMVYFIGGLTFLAASLLAISQSDGKKVLAYSTISNLGLIVACAGVGVQATIWAAVLLIIFHAVSKSMLFQCVGAIENATGSRDIEDMQGLAVRYPKLAVILMCGISCMFLAPFGMLISKWAALKAFVDAPSTIMVLLIVFGSATTMFYWTKWLAKILGNHRKFEEDKTQANEYISMFGHMVILILLCLGFPFLSRTVVEPLTMQMFNESSPVISSGNLLIMIVMICGVFIIPFVFYLCSSSVKRKEPLAYMQGENTGDNEHFLNHRGNPVELKVSNWYMEDWFGESKLSGLVTLLSTAIVLVFLCIILGGAAV